MAKEKQKCASMVWDTGGYRKIPCGKTGDHEHDGHWYCKQHYPPSVAERAAAIQARWDDEWAAARAQHERSEQLAARFNAALDACRQIAAGHPAPRALAAAVVAMPPEDVRR